MIPAKVRFERRVLSGLAAARESSGKVPRIGWFVGFGFLLALAVLIHFSIGWKSLFSPWGKVPARTMVAALGLVLISYAVRAIRLHQYFAPATKGQYPRTLRIQLLHNLFNNFLPMRSGEASFPILMKRNYEVPFTRSIPALLYLRLLDFHFLFLIGLAVFAAGAGTSAWIMVILFAPIPFLAFLAQGWVRIKVLGRLDPVGGPISRRGLIGDALGGQSQLVGPPKAFLGKIRDLARKSLDGFPGTPGLFWLVWLWTGLNWSVKLLVFAWILRAFSPMPFSHALLGSITGELSSVLPIHGLAGAGTYEAGIMVGLLPRELDVQAALSGAVNLHLFVLGASVLSGALAYLIPIRGNPGINGIGPAFETQSVLSAQDPSDSSHA